jgi:hypothetical protein
MKTKYPFNVLFLLFFVLISLLAVDGFELSFGESSELSTAVFTVQ